MSTTIDNRVVEMKFNNAQFENGAKTTLNTLERLKSALNFDGAAKGLARGFSNIENSINISGIASGVDAISDRFSALGVIGATVLSNLTTSAMNLASRLGGLVINPIVEGGKNRAQNIEHAKFQLEGLKVAWDDIEKDISYGVQDTAYGLDAAATVASQLVASNVQLGDSMKTALRGVSGVAAMTSSSYEEIGHIFTTVAGQGRLMGMQLTQLSMKGINAAATLGEALGKTEAEIRDMVSKGQIDFATFAKAMDDAYGAHAKDANKTFTGALSNTRAALARIGAKFATPAYENLKDVLNGLIPVINAVNKALDPFVTLTEKGMKKASTSIVDALNNFGKVKVTNIEQIETLAERVLKGEFGNGEERRKQLEALGESYEDVQSKVNALVGGTSSAAESTNVFIDIIKNAVNTIKNIIKPAETVWKSVRGAFKETFSGSAFDSMNKFSKKLSDVSEKFKITDDKAKKLKDTFGGVFGVVKLGETAVSGLLECLSPLAAFVNDMSSKISDSTLDKLSSIGEKTAKVAKTAKDNRSFFENLNEIFNYIRISLERLSPQVKTLRDSVKTLFQPLGGYLKTAGRGISDFFTKGLSEEQVSKAMVFGKILARAAETVLNIGTAVAKAAAPIKNAIVEMFPSVSLKNVLAFARGISEFTKKLIISDETADKLKRTFKGLFAIVDIAAQLFSAVFRTLFPTTNALFGLGEGIVTATGGLGDWLVALDENLKENDTFYNAIQKLTELIKTGFETAKEKVIEFAEIYKEKTGKELKMPTMQDVFDRFDSMKDKLSWVPDVVEKVKTSFTGFIEWLSKDESGNKAKSIDTIVNVLDKLSDISGKISPDLGDFFSNIGDAFDKIDFERMGKILNIGMFVVFINALIRLRGVISGLFNWDTLSSINGVLSGTRGALFAWSNEIKANTYVKIAQAIAILTGSLVALSMIDEKRLTSAMGAMTSMFIELFGAMSFMVNAMSITNKFTGIDPSKNLLAVAASALIIAGAVDILSVAVMKIGSLEPSQLASGLSAVFGLLLTISVVAAALSQKAGAGVIQAAAGIVVLSGAMIVMSGALKILSGIDNLFEGVLTIISVLSAVALVANFLPKEAGVALILFATSMVILSGAIVSLAAALKLMSNVENVFTSFLILADCLIIMTAVGLIIANFSEGILAAAAGMVVMAGALAILAPILIVLGKMELEELAKGLLVISGALLAFGGIAALLGNFAGQILGFAASMVVLSSAVLIMAGAFALLAPTFLAFGQMDLAGIGKGLFVMAAMIGVLAGAAALLSPVIPAILGFAGALVALGLAFTGIGVGIAALSIGISLLSTATLGLTVFIYGLGTALVALVESVVAVGMALLVGIEELVPKILSVGSKIIVGIVRLIVTNLPRIVAGGVMLILALLRGIESHIGDVIIVTNSLLVKLIEGIGLIIPSIVNAGIVLIIRLINGMANAIRENAEPLMIAMRNLVSSLVEFTITAIQQLARNIPIIGNSIYDGLETAKEAIRSFIAPDSFDDAADNIQNATDEMGEKAELGLSSMFPNFSDLGSKLGEKFSGGLGSTDGLAFNSASQIGDAAYDGLDMDFSDLGFTSGDTYVSGLLGNESSIIDVSGLLTDSATDTLVDADRAFSDSGEGNGFNYILGLDSKRNDANTSGDKLSGKSVEGVRSNNTDFRSAGADAGSGFAQGLFNDSRAEVYNAAASLARVALNSMKVTLNEHSPSKETEDIAGLGGDGFVRGLKNKIQVVKDAARLVASSATNTMRDTLLKASSILENGIDITPSIRPVVDMTEVESGAAAINSMLGRRTLAVGGTVGGFSNHAAESLAAAMSMAQRDNSSAKVVESVNELKGEVARLSESMAKMKVYIDGRALVGHIAGPLDDEFGRRMALKGRGV